MIGMKLMIGTVVSRPIRPLSQPHWKTATTTPKAPPMLSRMAMHALSGTRIERKATISSRKVQPQHHDMKIGSAPASSATRPPMTGMLAIHRTGRAIWCGRAPADDTERVARGNRFVSAHVGVSYRTCAGTESRTTICVSDHRRFDNMR